VRPVAVGRENVALDDLPSGGGGQLVTYFVAFVVNLLTTQAQLSGIAFRTGFSVRHPYRLLARFAETGRLKK
jgi:hypothetical protein